MSRPVKLIVLSLVAMLVLVAWSQQKGSVPRMKKGRTERLAELRKAQGRSSDLVQTPAPVIQTSVPQPDPVTAQGSHHSEPIGTDTGVGGVGKEHQLPKQTATPTTRSPIAPPTTTPTEVPPISQSPKPASEAGSSVDAVSVERESVPPTTKEESTPPVVDTTLVGSTDSVEKTDPLTADTIVVRPTNTNTVAVDNPAVVGDPQSGPTNTASVPTVNETKQENPQPESTGSVGDLVSTQTDATGKGPIKTDADNATLQPTDPMSIEDENIFYAKILRNQLSACGDLCNVNGSTYKVESAYGQDPFDKITAEVNCPKLFDSDLVDAVATRVPPPSKIPISMLHSFSLDGQTAVSYAPRLYYQPSIDASTTTEWPDSLIEGYVNELKSGTLKGGYGSVNVQNLLEVAKAHFSQKTMLVLGSATPWVEALLLYAGATHVYTVEHRVIQCDHPKVTPLTPREFNELYRQGKIPKIEGAVAFGTVGHSGLGRYGDVLNPWGDVMAVAKIWCVIPDDAVVAVSVFAGPLGKDVVEWNMRRRYGSLRLPRLFANYKITKVFPRTNWQLLFVAKKSDGSTNRIPRYGLEENAAADKEYFDTKLRQTERPVPTTATKSEDIKPIEKYDPYGKESDKEAASKSSPTSSTSTTDSKSEEVKPIEKYDPYGKEKEGTSPPPPPPPSTTSTTSTTTSSTTKPIEKYDPYGKESPVTDPVPATEIKSEEVKPIEKYDPYGKEADKASTPPSSTVGEGNEATATTSTSTTGTTKQSAEEVKPIEKYDPYGKDADKTSATTPSSTAGEGKEAAAATSTSTTEATKQSAEEVKPIEKYDPYNKATDTNTKPE
eukprot:TRINITY_DN6917_c0_g1_i1.p1 TRINITY_DN6917_c0_g1~~TRINITY_DN6917_c0_g1_i1.p1  ORF type:complete len:835 (+),score=225.07 TRINITY_DN6917_c0_g1_i1:92-2596(+)